MRLMKKQEAIDLLGGTIADVARAVGTTHSAICQWPDVLPPRLADRVIAACARGGIAIPNELLTAPARGEAHEATLICRVAGVNPMEQEGERK